MEGISNHTNIRVRYEETDQMGYVYYGNYFTWFEIGRTELFRSMGLPYTLFEKRGIMLPVIEADCKYKRSPKYDDNITLKTWVTRFSPVRIHFSYQVLSEDGKVMAFGNTGHAFTDRSGSPINLSKKDPEWWNKILSLSSAETVS